MYQCFFFKLVHCLDEHFYALDGECIVERCTESAYRAVALDAHYALCRGEVNEFFLKLHIFGLHNEAYIHYRTILRLDSTYKHLAGVDGAVEQFGLGKVAAFHLFHTAEFLVVLEGLES